MTDPAKEEPTARASTRPWYLNRWLLGGLAALAVYTAAGFLLVPYLVRHYVPEIAAQQLMRQAGLGEVRVNPFKLTFEARDFAFTEADGAPILAFDRLFLDLELESLTRWAWTFAEIRVEGPALNLVVDEENRLNLARLVDALPQTDPPDPQAEPTAPPRLLLKHIALEGGRMVFTDRTDPTPASVTLQPLDLRLDDISTLPERRGPYAISASLPGGGTLSWDGEVALNPVASSGTLKLSGFRPVTAWEFVRDSLRLAEPEGEIDVEAGYRFAYTSGRSTLQVDPIAVAVRDLELTEEGAGSPMLALASIDVTDARFDLDTREITVPSLALRDGQLAVSVDPEGTVSWAALATPGTDEPPPESAGAPAEPDARPWQVRLESLTLDGVAMAYSDASRTTPITITSDTSRAALALQVEAGGAETALVADGIEITLQQVALSETDGEPLVDLGSLALQGGRFDLAERGLTIERVAIEGGSSQLVRKRDGSIPLLTAMNTGDAGKVRRELEQAGSSAEAEGRPWRFSLDQLELTNFDLGYTDEITRPPLRYDLEKVGVTIDRISNDGTTPLAYDASLEVRQGGSARVTGTLTQSGDAAEARVELTRLALEPLAPLVAGFTTLELQSGSVSGHAELNYTAGTDRSGVQAGGTVRIDDLLLNEAASGERLLAWRSLAANDIAFSLAPDALTIREVRLQEPGLKLVIFEDKSVNLASLARPEKAEATAASAGSAPSTGDGKAPFPVTVERVQIENGGVDFADLSLVLPFATEVQGMQGSVVGIASDPAARTTLEFEGTVGEFGEARASGSLAPSDPTGFTDIGVRFRNVATTQFSPYSATFAGRKIASGTLDLDLEYKIEKSEMLGQNKVVLKEFTLGEPVESPDAMSLPLDLAIALLTDGEGRIDVSVPVSGNVDSPEFSYGQVVLQAIANLVVKAVSAPFRALGSALGGDSEAAGEVAFAPGRDTLSPPEREQLLKLAEALVKRPQLKVVVHGTFDPDRDGGAIKDRELRLELAQALEISLEPGVDPGPIAYDNAKTQRALEAIAVARGGKEAVDTFQVAFETTAGRPAKRVNRALALVGRASEDREFYQALVEHLVTSAPLPEAELEALAARRAEAVMQELTAAGDLEATRVSIGVPETVTAEGETVPARLELDVQSKAG